MAFRLWSYIYSDALPAFHTRTMALVLKEPIQSRLLNNLQTQPSRPRRRVYQIPVESTTATLLPPSHRRHSPPAAQRYVRNIDTERLVLGQSPPAQPRAESYTEARKRTATVPPPSPGSSVQKGGARELHFTVRPRSIPVTAAKAIQSDNVAIEQVRHEMREQECWGETRSSYGPSSISPQVGESLIRRSMSVPPARHMPVESQWDVGSASSSLWAANGSFATWSISVKPR